MIVYLQAFYLKFIGYKFEAFNISLMTVLTKNVFCDKWNMTILYWYFVYYFLCIGAYHSLFKLSYLSKKW